MERLRLLWKGNQSFKVEKTVIKYLIKVQTAFKIKGRDRTKIKEITETFVCPGVMGERLRSPNLEVHDYLVIFKTHFKYAVQFPSEANWFPSEHLS